MARWRPLPVVVLSLVVLGATAWLSTRAQGPATPPALPLQEALNKPFVFPFAAETPLEKVADHLRKTLNARVVIDRAALSRLGVGPNDTVQLSLDGARLKVGLKLLLDQLQMTYRVEPDDNLLILTDSAGSAEPIDKVLTEIKALHRDVHDLQDALDQLRQDLDLDVEEDGPKMRQPTIIEEIPAAPAPGGKPRDDPATSPKPRRSGV